jgi:hypothetical protein
MQKPAADPIERFQTLAALAAPTEPDLEPDALKPVIDEAKAAGKSEAAAVATQVAKHSRLTVAQAEPVVKAALEATPTEDSTAKAAAVSEAVKGAAGISGNIELSDPVMLNPEWRAIFSGVLFLALATCIGCITALSKESKVQESAIVGLTIVGILSLVAMLVLVMGYKNVTIKGGSSAGGSS